MAAAPTKESLLAEILDQPDEAIRAHQRGDVPAAVLRELAAAAQHPDLRYFLAAYPETPARILEQLAEGEEPVRIREALAAHPRAPRAVLMHLAGDPATRVRLAVAANRALTPQVALLLAEDEAVPVRLALAGNPAIPPRTQSRLAADANPLVRSMLLGKGQLDTETQKLLADTDDPLLLAETVAGSDAPDSALLAWADGDQFVPQMALLLRPRLSEKVLESLCFSTHPPIQRAALERHQLSTDEMLGWSQSEEPSVRVLIASRPGLPPQIQQMLAGDATADVRQALAENPGLDGAVAQQLAQDADPAVQTALALNPKLPTEARTALCGSASRVVRKLLAARTDLTVEQIARLLDDGDEEVAYHLAGNDLLDRELPDELARRWATHSLPSLRALAASSPELDESVLAALAVDPAPLVRRELAWNAALPQHLRERLVEDEDAIVAERARTAASETDDEETDQEGPEPERQGFLQRLLGRVLSRNSES
jgi:hypothetical protein